MHMAPSRENIMLLAGALLCARQWRCMCVRLPSSAGRRKQQLTVLRCAAQWPGVQGEAQPPNAELLLYGGAAFERCLDELREAARQLAFPAGTRFV